MIVFCLVLLINNLILQVTSYENISFSMDRKIWSLSVMQMVPAPIYYDNCKFIQIHCLYYEIR